MSNPVLWLAEHPELLPLAIFLMRVCDVSLDTLRMIFIVRGMRALAVVFGFFAVLIWLAAISAVMARLSESPFNMIAYAAGYATGNWVGMWLEGRLAIGQQVVQLISNDLAGRLADGLRAAGYVVTELEGHGRDAPVKLCYVATRRREVPSVIRRATAIDPAVFVTVEDVRAANRPLFRYAPAGAGSPGAAR